ncbi:MAG: hypothetical protein ACK6AY_10385 [Akkermansiaceae bacterium]
MVDPEYAPGGSVEHKTNGLMFGIDNWMYNSKSNIRHKFIDGKIIRDKTETRGQFGITRDNLGRLYHNTNSLTLAGDRVLPNLMQGNPAVNTKTTITTKRLFSKLCG